MPRPATKKVPARVHRREGARLVTVSATDEEIARWDAAAAADRRDRSAWIRLTLDRAAESSPSRSSNG